MARRGSWRSFALALHPVLVLLAQRWQVFSIDAIAFRLRGEVHHVGEEGRLGAARVIRAIAVWHMTYRVDEVCEVVEHVIDEVLASGHLQAEHGGVRVPVIAFLEPSARHYIRFG